MMTTNLRMLIDVTAVLAVGAWACRFMWRHYRRSKKKHGDACNQCRKCDH